MSIDKTLCNLLQGAPVCAADRAAAVAAVRERITREEQGAVLAVAMEALGCNYDAACDAIFSGDSRAALRLLDNVLLKQAQAEHPAH